MEFLEIVISDEGPADMPTLHDVWVVHDNEPICHFTIKYREIRSHVLVLATALRAAGHIVTIDDCRPYRKLSAS